MNTLTDELDFCGCSRSRKTIFLWVTFPRRYGLHEGQHASKTPFYLRRPDMFQLSPAGGGGRGGGVVGGRNIFDQHSIYHNLLFRVPVWVHGFNRTRVIPPMAICGRGDGAYRRYSSPLRLWMTPQWDTPSSPLLQSTPRQTHLKLWPTAKEQISRDFIFVKCNMEKTILFWVQVLVALLGDMLGFQP